MTIWIVSGILFYLALRTLLSLLIPTLRPTFGRRRHPTPAFAAFLWSAWYALLALALACHLFQLHPSTSLLAIALPLAAILATIWNAYTVRRP